MRPADALLEDRGGGTGVGALVLGEVGGGQAEAGGVPGRPALRAHVRLHGALEQDRGGVGLPWPAEVGRERLLVGDQVGGGGERAVLERQPRLHVDVAPALRRVRVELAQDPGLICRQHASLEHRVPVPGHVVDGADDVALAVELPVRVRVRTSCPGSCRRRTRRTPCYQQRPASPLLSAPPRHGPVRYCGHGQPQE